MTKRISQLPLVITEIDRANLLPALESVRGCLKTTSMLWMRALGLPVLSGVVIAGWSEVSATAVQRFCKKNQFSNLLLRIDKRDDRWTRRRGGYIVSLSQIPQVVEELRKEGMLTLLLEPASPYGDQYSLAGITVPDQGRMIVEVVGPGFDASDILRSDLQAHERWEFDDMPMGMPPRRAGAPGSLARTKLVTPEQYAESVQQRLAKIGARTKNPAFPDTELKGRTAASAELIQRGTAFLKSTHQTTLLNHAKTYAPIQEKHLASFVRHVQSLLSGLSAYGIHLGPSSFAASVIPKRGLIFWDFFPARKQEAASLYPAA